MKIAIITGGSRGLGRSAALQCAARGMGVIVTYNSHPGGAQAVVAEIEAAGGKVAALALDVGQTATFGAFRDQIATALADIWGRTDFESGWINAQSIEVGGGYTI